MAGEKSCVLVICTHGKNRSKYLAEYLAQKGYEADFVGAANEDAALVRAKIDRADVIITVHDAVREKLAQRFDLHGKRHVELHVEDRPELVLPSGDRLEGDAWMQFQQTHVYPKLEEQINAHLPF